MAQTAPSSAPPAKGRSTVEIDVAWRFNDVATALEPFNGKQSSSVHVRFINASKAKKVRCFEGWTYSKWVRSEEVIASVDLNELNDVTEIGDNFLRWCRELKEIDLTGFKNVSSIGEEFLSNCTGLTQLDLFPLSSVAFCGGSFLRCCGGLTKLGLSPLSNVTTIGHRFLYKCSGLTQLDLSPLSNVTTVADWFLFECTGLTQLDLSSLSNVTTIADGFLFGCSELTRIDMSGLVNVSSIERGFLNVCPLLSKVIGLPDCIRDKLPKDHPVRKHGQRYWRMFALLIRQKSRGHAYNAFQIWNVMRFVAEFL